MIVPDIIHGPEMVFGNEFFEGLARRNRRAGTGFRVVAVGAAGLRVFEPVRRRNIFVRAGHLDAGRAGDGSFLLGGGGNDGVRPAQLFLDSQVHLLDVGWRRIVAAVQENKNAGVIAQTRDLIAQGSGGDAILIALPMLPAFPGVAAGPAGHDENAELVGFFEKFVAVEAAFETNGVEVHVANVSEVGVEFCGRPAEEQVGGPGSAANQNFAAIHFEEAMIFVSKFGGDFTDAEGQAGGV